MKPAFHFQSKVDLTRLVDLSRTHWGVPPFLPLLLGEVDPSTKYSKKGRLDKISLSRGGFWEIGGGMGGGGGGGGYFYIKSKLKSKIFNGKNIKNLNWEI